MNLSNPFRKFAVSLLLCAMATGAERTGAQVITTFAGTGTFGFSGDGGAASAAKLHQPFGVAIDGWGNVYIADDLNHRIRVVDTSGIISTFAGNGTVGSGGDGTPATAAELDDPAGVAVDRAGNVYITDNGAHRVRKVNSLGIISAFAGNGTPGHTGDGGAATAAELYSPSGLGVDAWGNVYITDNSNHDIRKVDTSGIISNFAGNGTPSFGGDGGAATAAELNSPIGAAIDDSGNVYIADQLNNRIRKVNRLGIISTFAGTGAGAYSGDGGAATSAEINNVAGVGIDLWGNVYIGDETNNRVRKVDTSGVISTIAGNGTLGYSGDLGAATAAQLHWPTGVVVNSCGSLYIADWYNNCVRKVTYPPVLTTPTISLSGISTAPAGATVTVNATVGSAGSSYNIYWYNNGVLFATTTTPTATYTQTPGTDTITALIVPTGYGCYDSTTSAQHLVTAVSTGLDVARGNSLGLTLYPDPANTNVTVGMSASEGVLTVYNLISEAMINEKMNGKQTTLNISGLPPGVYIITVTDAAGNRATGRLLKE